MATKKPKPLAKDASLAALFAAPLPEWDRLVAEYELASDAVTAHYDRVLLPIEDRVCTFERKILSNPKISDAGKLLSHILPVVSSASGAVFPEYQREDERQRELCQRKGEAEKALLLCPAPDAAAFLYKLRIAAPDECDLEMPPEAAAVLKDDAARLMGGEVRQ